MKIVVIGGSGQIGSRLVKALQAQGHQMVAASPSSGVNTITREGLAEAMNGADVVVDVSNAPSWEDAAVLAFFQTSTQNLVAAARAHGVGHYLALSIVGTDGMADNGYMRAKKVQQDLIKASGLPYTIVQATQFFEFLDLIIQAGADGDVIRLSPALIQPIAADDVVAALSELVVSTPQNETIELAGPEPFPLDALARNLLARKGDKRAVIADVHARYFGVQLTDKSLTPQSPSARLAPTKLDDWLKR
ncbi:SDR family oxidoreductase [Tardiphaga alba]|uniref:SDR family oxidoreductase n=1 Tax=Tardiphaga alba TaxID=340268 RepID=A0ABX8ABZ0_9BRAD|nr:SDR family oxidoreductase [Tardiphaga alba]QUS39320.1 SDR family oxidoreductase [Tardiphaga alba]